MLSSFFFFFFQAEDGIRDTSVTGVQTCALPILLPIVDNFQRALEVVHNGQQAEDQLAVCELALLFSLILHPASVVQIGRASCRERVEMSVVAVTLEWNDVVKCERACMHMVGNVT